MLSKEEKKVIKKMNRFARISEDMTVITAKEMDIVLKLVENYKYLYKKALDDLIKSDKENSYLKKQIDLMTEYIDDSNYVDSEECQFQYDFKIKKCIEKGDCKDCIKQYFESKSKEE